MRLRPSWTHGVVALLLALTMHACVDLPNAPEEIPLGATPCLLDDAYEENDSPARATPIGFGVIQAVRCRLLGDVGAGDDDFYSYSGEAGRWHRAVLASPLASSRRLRLFDAVNGDGVALAFDGNFVMPASGKLLVTPDICCVEAGDSVGYALSLVEQANRAPVPQFTLVPERPVVGRDAVLTSTSTDPDGDALQPATWRLGDGRTTTGSPAAVTWATRGTHTVVLVVTDALGRADSLARVIEVDPDVSSIVVTPAQTELASIGDTQRLTATAQDSLGATVSDIAFTWTSSDSSIARVTTAGAVIAYGNGTATVSAAAYGTTGSATVTVRQRVARLSTGVASLRFATLQRTASLKASVQDARGNPMSAAGISWRSADANVASIDSTGLVTALSRGATTVTAAFDTLRADVAVTVAPVAASVTVAPTAANLTALADTVRFVATARDSAGYDITPISLSWTSGAPAIATVDAAGLVHPVANGTTIVTADAGTASAAALVTVVLAGSGPPVALIASPDTAFVLQPWTTTPVFKARVVDGAGVNVPGQAYSWRFLTPEGDRTIDVIGATTGDSILVQQPYYGASGRVLVRIEVTSGAFADTVLFYQVAPRQWQSLAAGRAHTCGVVADDYGDVNNHVYCWGDNSRGQLGLPASLADSSVPVRVPLDGVRVVEVSAGDDYTCAGTLTGSVYCWGANQYGQLGYVSSDNCGGMDCSRTPGVVAGVSAGTVSAGPEHVCVGNAQVFILGFATPPEIHCWGRNQYGQLGLDPGATAFLNVPSAVAGVPATGGIEAVEAFGGTTCFVISSVRRCMGLNSSGEYGMNSTASGFSPTAPAVPPPSLKDDQIHGGVGFACGRPYLGGLNFGRISCWGTDALGQLGLTPGYVRQTCGGSPCVINATASPLPQPLYLASPILAGSGYWDVGAAHVCVVTASNDLVCWGDNTSGQLGDGSTTGRSAPVLIPLPAGTLRGVMTAGASHTCVDIDGAGLYCWGNGGNGRLGDGARVNRLTPVRVRDP